MNSMEEEVANLRDEVELLRKEVKDLKEKHKNLVTNLTKHLDSLDDKGLL